MGRHKLLLGIGLATLLGVLLCGCQQKTAKNAPPPGGTASGESAGGAGATNPPPTPEAPKTPDSAWTGNVKDFTYRDAKGGVHKLSEHAGQPIVVDFWAVWCGYCVQELPEIQKLVNAHKGEFVMLNVAVDNEQDPVGYWKQNGYTWNLGLDVDGSSTYGVTGIPVTLFIDRQGNISQRFDGAVPPEQFSAALGKILAPGGASV